MADKCSNEGSSSSTFQGDSSDSVVVLNVKTLDSQIYTFDVNKKMSVLSFKDKISHAVGVSVGQQRLIFRGKVLQDDQLLSQYHVENGDTLHLVVRQQPQPSSDTSSGNAVVNDGNQGNDANADVPRNRVGQISHSVVLGTFNVGEQGEGAVPDMNRVIGSVLNSFGLGNQQPTNGMQTASLAFGQASQGNGIHSNFGFQAPQGNGIHSNFGFQAPQGNGIRSNFGFQNQTGDHMQAGQAFPANPFPHFVRIPVAAAAAVPAPSFHVPIPDSLHTLSEFMRHMEQALSQNDFPPDTSSTRDLPNVELPTTAQMGLPTLESLSIVMRQAQRLLSEQVIAALSHTAGRLEQEGGSSDLDVRAEVKAESVQVGFAMQHLGALLLELGRTILTLRMGMSPAEASVSSGPAVYISPSGPNPIMVQPFSLQTNSLFGGAVPPSNPATFGPVGVGSAPRNINIHIHAVGGRPSNVQETQGEQNSNTSTVGGRPSNVQETQGEQNSNTGSGGLETGVSDPIGVSVSNHFPGEPVSLEQRSFFGSSAGNRLSNEQSSNIVVSSVEETLGSLCSTLPEVNLPEPKSECIKRGGNEKTRSSVGESMSSSSKESTVISEDATKNPLRSSEKDANLEGARAIPLGLGMGGMLERKKRSATPKSMIKSGDAGTSNVSVDQNPNAGTSAQQLLHALVSRSSTMNLPSADDLSANQSHQVTGTVTGEGGRQGSPDQLDAASAISEALQSPAIDDLLSGFSAHTGVGSPNVMRNMFQQFVQNPQIMNTVQQIAQQVDGESLENMFSGLGGRGQRGGGFDLSQMVQQMMPVVSRAFGHGSTTSSPFPAVEPDQQQQYEERSNGANRPDDHGFQINTRPVAQMIENSSSPGDVFHAIAESAARLNGDESNLLDELCSDEELATEYKNMLIGDLSRRFRDDSRH